MNLSEARRVNAREIFTIIRLTPGASQSDIVQQTGIDKTTVSTIINRLEADNIIERRSKHSGLARGRPMDSISIASNAGRLYGIAIETNRVSFASAGFDGVLIGKETKEYDGSPDALRRIVAEGIKELNKSSGRRSGALRAVGMCVSGPFGHDGKLHHMPARLINTRLNELVAELSTVPAFYDNDARAATLAERLFGSHRGADDFAYVNIGVGVGAGFVLGGQLYDGAAGFAGEFGHTKIVPNGQQCRCGGFGCLSAYVSESGIVRRLNGQGIEIRSIEEIAALHAAGDHRLLAPLAEAGGFLGYGLANLANLLNPSLIILGGRATPLFPLMMPTILSTFEREALGASHEGCEVAISVFKDDVTLLGAIALALDGFTAVGLGQIATSARSA